jgi:hypothetical protein
MKTIAIKLPDDLLARIREAAAKRGETRSAVMRAALLEYFPRGKDQNGRSCLALAGDLAGSLEGPSDLSTNPAYMDGYGK